VVKIPDHGGYASLTTHFFIKGTAHDPVNHGRRPVASGGGRWLISGFGTLVRCRDVTCRPLHPW
jgi:hypothetical protein